MPYHTPVNRKNANPMRFFSPGAFALSNLAVQKRNLTVDGIVKPEPQNHASKHIEFCFSDQPVFKGLPRLTWTMNPNRVFRLSKHIKAGMRRGFHTKTA